MSVVYNKKRDPWSCGTTKEIADEPNNYSGLNGGQSKLTSGFSRDLHA